MSNFNSNPRHKFNERLTTIANASQIGGFLLQVIGIIVPLITVGIISSQENTANTLSIKFISGSWFLSLLLFCSLFFILQFYRNFWGKYQYEKSLDSSYWKFLLHEIPVRFPAFLAPLILVIGWIICIAPPTLVFFVIVGCGAIIFIGIISFIEANEKSN